MLIAKGYGVSFEMKQGPVVRAPAGAALLHDPTGKHWPSCSGLVMRFTKTNRPIHDDAAKEYLGIEPRAGSITTPPRRLSEWKRVGDVAVINYRRIGEHADSYYHPIERGAAVLYRRPGALRVELGGGCVWNWRGIVKP